MKLIAAILAFCVCQAHAMTGNELVSACQSQNAEFSRCVGYLDGYTDGRADMMFKYAPVFGTEILRKPPYNENDIEIVHAGYCLPSGVTLNQLRNVFLQYAAQNPAETHLPAGKLLTAAFWKAFPCATPQPLR